MFDVIGIGVGPYNLSLAALMQKTVLNGLFVEQKSHFNWHDGMLLNNAYLQIHFLNWIYMIMWIIRDKRIMSQLLFQHNKV